MTASQELDAELKRLLVGTNDQRRRVGQTLFHFYRTLIFWKDRGLGFLDITKAWSAGGAAVFDALARTLAEVAAGPREEPQRDGKLRAFLAGFLAQLAGDVERGDHMLVPFLRWLEERFPELTAMMRDETPGSQIHDVALAEDLAGLFVALARAAPGEVAPLLRETAARLG